MDKNEQLIYAVEKRGSSKFSTIIAVLIPSVILLTIWLCSFLYHRYYYKEQIVVKPGEDALAIYIMPNDTATMAAAQYLANAIERTTGAKTEIVTEKDSTAKTFSILYGAEMNAQSVQKEKVLTIMPTAANDEKDYSINYENDEIILHIPNRADCFGAVKAFADRWLQPDCGLRDDRALMISRAMIDEQLSGLPIDISGTFRILTQNLRYTDDEDGNSVKERAVRFVKLVEEYQPDLIGTQECTLQWLQLLQEAFSDRYELFGCSRLGPDSDAEEWNAVLYRKDRFTIRDGETFWLSNTPGEVASKLNYDGCVRICTWVLLLDTETGKTLLFSNTHLQDGGSSFYQEVREQQAEILLRHLRTGNNKLMRYPGFLTGDFNGEHNEAFYSQITLFYKDSATIAINDNSAVDFSFHAYGNTRALIDFCFCSPKATTVLDYQILDNLYGGYVSDHYGVLVTAVVN